MTAVPIGIFSTCPSVRVGSSAASLVGGGFAPVFGHINGLIRHLAYVSAPF